MGVRGLPIASSRIRNRYSTGLHRLGKRKKEGLMVRGEPGLQSRPGRFVRLREHRVKNRQYTLSPFSCQAISARNIRYLPYISGWIYAFSSWRIRNIGVYGPLLEAAYGSGRAIFDETRHGRSRSLAPPQGHTWPSSRTGNAVAAGVGRIDDAPAQAQLLRAGRSGSSGLWGIPLSRPAGRQETAVEQPCHV